jgi:hypothetical protein
VYRTNDDGGHWAEVFVSPKPDDALDVLAVAARPTLPTSPVPSPSVTAPGVRWFPQTHHTLSGPFLTFYNANNGLKILGLPLTEPFPDGGKTVQYFERAELAATAAGVSEVHLSSMLTQGRSFPTIPTFVSSRTKMYFPVTKHSLSGTFLAFWQSHNGAQWLGSPISEPLKEQNGDGTGRTYLVQYFQNARLEYHPELAGAGNQVTLGLLGKEALRQRGWL